MSQETASEAFERTYLAGLEVADKNFVLDPDVPWPALRTKANPMAEPAPSKKRRKGVRSNDHGRNEMAGAPSPTKRTAERESLLEHVASKRSSSSRSAQLQPGGEAESFGGGGR